jgi:biotin operon repressor
MPRATTPTAHSELASNRTFGCEFEFYGVDHMVAIRALRNAGIQINGQVSYNHHDSASHWKIVTDASVRGRHAGELVSPKLNGNAGLAEVRKALRVMVEAGASVNRSCGLHVHVDARGLDVPSFANVITRYAHFERELDKIMPASRRGSENTYCGSITHWVQRYRSFMQEQSTAREIANIAPRDKVNLGSFLRHGSIEFRHHSGTVNAEKATNWIKFCVNFVEKSRLDSALNAAASPSQSVNSRETGRVTTSGRARNSRTLVKLHSIVSLLGEAGSYGLTTANIAQHVGYSETSVTVMISKLRTEYGFTIRKRSGSYRLIRRGSLPEMAQGVNNSTPMRPRYPSHRDYGQRSRRSVRFTLPTSYTGSAFDGLPQEVVNYYEERRADLAAA